MRGENKSLYDVNKQLKEEKSQLEVKVVEAENLLDEVKRQKEEESKKFEEKNESLEEEIKSVREEANKVHKEKEVLKEELKVYKARMKAFDDVKLELKKNVSVIQKQGKELLEMNKSAESEVEQLRIREEEAKKTQAGLLKEVEDLEEEGFREAQGKVQNGQNSTHRHEACL